MRRREAMLLLAGAATNWPLHGSAQTPELGVRPRACRHPQLRRIPICPCQPFPERASPAWLHRGAELGDKPPLGRWTSASPSGAGGRADRPQGRHHHSVGTFGLGGEACNHDHPDRDCLQRGPGRNRHGPEPCPTRRQHHGVLVHVSRFAKRLELLSETFCLAVGSPTDTIRPSRPRP